MAEHPRQGASITTDLAILGRDSKAGGLADLADIAKERSTGV
jgi:hypothetical protein